MAAPKGAEHHNVVALREAKKKVLQFVAQGLPLADALARAERKQDVMKRNDAPGARTSWLSTRSDA